MAWNPFARTKAPSTPEGFVVFAIGDVHGRADLLRPLLGAIADDIEAHPGLHAVIIGLGDYVDRGPEPGKVLDLLLHLSKAPGLDVCLLRGNHEQVVLDFLDDARVGPAWCTFGGRETLAAYGVTAPATEDDEDAWAAAQAAFRAALPPRHLKMLQGLKPCAEAGDYFFAHAGARPGVSLHAQEEKDLFWIREPFLSDRKPFDQVVVHGHSAEVKVFADRRRIGIDTGAYATGMLTCLRLEGERRDLIQARKLGGRTDVNRTALEPPA